LLRGRERRAGKHAAAQCTAPDAQQRADFPPSLPLTPPLLPSLPSLLPPAQIEKFKKANKYIKEETIWSYLIQICRGLQGMHGRNVLHRDIKAKNIFLTGKNHVRLGDLGCAKLLKAGMARTQIGTPYYMSPEIWSNKPYDAKSDIWAVGCLLYELTMLQPPFLANDMNALAQKIKTTTAPRISKHYSEDLANLVASMLRPDPKQRPTVDQLLSSPAVTSRLQAVPPEEEGIWAGGAYAAAADAVSVGLTTAGRAGVPQQR
jgi:serine/threonine protein kinase